MFGLTLLVGGLAQQVEVSAAIGAFLVGLALSGPVQRRAGTVVAPLRDLFAAVFFLFFSFQLRPGNVARALAPATLIAEWWPSPGRSSLAGSPPGGPAWARRGRVHAGATLIARGEFSIVIASLGASLADGEALGATAAAFVLITAVVGPVAARFADCKVTRAP